MNNYINWNRKTITDFSEENIISLYDSGYVFGRIEKGNINQTRSLRINLEDFELNSENRRVLRKVKGLEIHAISLPYKGEEYDWMIHSIGKDFYKNKLENVKFSASKIKELVTNGNKSNFNQIFEYSISDQPGKVGYAICYVNSDILHYAYPFYNYKEFSNNYGMGMMLKAIIWAKENNKKHIYLGSAKDPKDKYKLQFKSIEWFDGENWNQDISSLKELLS